MKRMAMAAVTASVLLCTARSEETQSQAKTQEVSDLDDVLLGHQLTGSPLSYYDLVGRVVVGYQWCITCPLSTGAFPYINQLNEKYRDKGVVFVGFQVRRDPKLIENNIVFFAEHLQPNFPITRRGWVGDWPVKFLPWAVVYDHSGKKIFADNLAGLYEAIAKAVAEAPDIVVGGPYEKLKLLADKIASDKPHAGLHMKELRDLLVAGEADAATLEEAEFLLARIEWYFQNRLLKASDASVCVVEEVEICRKLADMFEGDKLGDEAGTRLEKLTSDANFRNECKAHEALKGAKAAFRKLPPAGRYSYNMNYHRTKDKTTLAKRSRMIAEFRMALKRIVENYPGTYDSVDAEWLMTENEMPKLGKKAAEERLKTTGEQADKAATPFELYR